MTLEEKKIEFAVFCIENVAKRLNKHAEDTYLRFQKAGVTENYILPFYDTLHTQSKEYIVDEVIEALTTREKKGGSE